MPIIELNDTKLVDKKYACGYNREIHSHYNGFVRILIDIFGAISVAYLLEKEIDQWLNEKKIEFSFNKRTGELTLNETDAILFKVKWF